MINLGASDLRSKMILLGMLLSILFRVNCASADSWSQYANEDSEVSEILAKEKHISWATYFKGQGIEKELKRRIMQSGTANPRNHVLSELCASYLAINPKAGDLCAILSKVPARYSDVRYPGFNESKLSSILASMRQGWNELNSNLNDVSNQNLDRAQTGDEIESRNTPSELDYEILHEQIDIERLTLPPSLNAVYAQWKSATLEDFELSKRFRESHPRYSTYFLYSAVEKLLKSRLEELGLDVPGGHDLSRLCRSLPWEQFNCEILTGTNKVYVQSRYPDVGNDSIGLQALQNSLDQFYLSATSKLAVLHPISRLKETLRLRCNATKVYSGMTEFIKPLDLKDGHRFPDRFGQQYGKRVLNAQFPVNLAVEPLEVWLGPSSVTTPCLLSLGYTKPRRISAPSSDYRALFSSVFRGMKVLLVLGSVEMSYLPSMHLEILANLRINQISLDQSKLTALVPFEDSNEYFKILAKIWGFYALDTLPLSSTPQVVIGYGTRLGGGGEIKRHLRSSAAQPICPFKFNVGPHSLVVIPADSKPVTLFLNTLFADLLGLPMYYLGQELGERGVPVLGHWSTAGDIGGDLKRGDIFLPAEFAGPDMQSYSGEFSPSKERFRNFVSSTDLLPKVYRDGTLGSIYNSGIEFSSIERLMKSWHWSAVDTDAFPLFQGYYHALQSGRGVGVYLISDVSSSEASREAAEFTPNQKLPPEQIQMATKLMVQEMGIDPARCQPAAKENIRISPMLQVPRTH